LDKIEDIVLSQDEKIKRMAKIAEEKIKDYYPVTDGEVYIIATSKFILYLIYFFYYLINNYYYYN
jgi:hypothetical protein